MALSFYDTATRTQREFVPIEPGKAGIYLCGATVQAPPHVGHIRSGVAFDVLRRWLIARDYDVTFIRNVTDIDDKIINNGKAQGIPYWLVAINNERAFTDAYNILGCLPPTYEPRATGHITEMVTLMQRLIEAGHAYELNGDVYFDVKSFATYGNLSGQKPDDMVASADSEAMGKRDARDFAMWKSVKPGEPSWPTPFGDGRPGWHIECSAMAGKYLGPNFDIHGGGLDLIFPHHENEIAQSQAVGDGFANYWMHNAWVTTAGEKMSKSLGNSLLVSEVVKRIRPVDLRYYLVSVHYRSMLEYSDGSVQEAGQAFRRIEGFIARAQEFLGAQAQGLTETRPQQFDDAMDDDLSVAQGCAVLHDTVRAGNAALTEQNHQDVAVALGSVLGMLDVLGLHPRDWPKSAGGSDQTTEVIDGLVQALLVQRQEARARKDFEAADAIRNGLDSMGIRIEDTPQGARWTLEQ
ncbi:MAG: cysteine--tRNA ligase [Candidatus Nanopelagicales bacterium]|nr:cysteine--tRNA ligase [Candidatus Nanopelagicales bacterium]MDD2819075.1 cysteine--tRNA ligase [Candidatus Nanopelagicales bacterium]